MSFFFRIELIDNDQVFSDRNVFGKDYVVKNFAVLYDVLADAVDEINAVFSKQVELYLIFYFYFS